MRPSLTGGTPVSWQYLHQAYRAHRYNSDIPPHILRIRYEIRILLLLRLVYARVMDTRA